MELLLLVSYVKSCWWSLLPITNYRPQTEVWGKVIFLHQFVILSTGGARVVAWGVRGCSGGRGCAWLLGGGACMVALEGCAWLLRGCIVAPGVCAWLLGGHVWLLLGGVHGCSRGACMVAPAGWACMVAPGGHAWLLWGGMYGCLGGHVWFYLGEHVWFYSGGHAWFFQFFRIQ